jgi:hypothetical protein
MAPPMGSRAFVRWAPNATVIFTQRRAGGDRTLCRDDTGGSVVKEFTPSRAERDCPDIARR